MSRIAELNEKIAKIEKGINSKATPEAQRKAMISVKEKLEASLAEEEKKASEKPAKKAPVAKKEAPKKKEKKQDDHIITINGKAYDVADCREAIVAWEARSRQSKEASKDYKTKPVAEKVAANVATAVKQAADGISDTRMDKNSKSVVKGAQMIEKAIDMMFKGFEEMTGKKVSQEQRKQIMSILADVKEEAKS